MEQSVLAEDEVNEGQLESGMDEIWPAAFERSDLPNLTAVSEILGLGAAVDERFATEMLANAGITVELIGDASPNVVRFDFLQIVCEEEAAERMTSAREVRLSNKVDMMGFVCKLNGELNWRVKIVDENRPHHFIGKRAGRSSAAAGVSTFMNHQIHETFVPHDDTVRATVAMSGGITITVLFKCQDNNTGEHAKWNKDNVPEIRQRRIDMLFVNKHVASLCVRRSVLF
jgi:hypothetical protein